MKMKFARNAAKFWMTENAGSVIFAGSVGVVNMIKNKKNKESNANAFVSEVLDLVHKYKLPPIECVGLFELLKHTIIRHHEQEDEKSNEMQMPDDPDFIGVN